MSELQQWLDRFESNAAKGPWSYRWHHHHRGAQHTKHVVFGVMTHGDEVGSLPAAVRLIEALNSGELSFGGHCTVVIGNPEAGLANKRFLEADLNRVFTDGFDPSLHEVARSREMMPILSTADLFLDFHQTILATEQSFYIGPYDTLGWRWSRALQCSRVWVTRPPGQSFSSGTCCADEYVRNLGRAAMTAELSQKGFIPEAEAAAMHTMKAALAITDAIEAGEQTLEQASEAQPELDFYQTVYAHPLNDPRQRLAPGLVNFQAVRAGQQLSPPEGPHIECPTDGMLLFPKYPDRTADGEAIAPFPNELFRVVQRMTEHPNQAWS